MVEGEHSASASGGGGVQGHADHHHCQSPRFAHTARPYTAEQVVSKRGTIPISYPSNIQAKKLYKMLEAHYNAKTPSHTYGALDPVQVSQMAKHLETVYVSGWQSSSTASSTNEVSGGAAASTASRRLIFARTPH